MNIPIVYEDDWLLIVNKPAGLLSVPTPKGGERTLTGILNQDALEKGAQYRLYPCHRLDRQTSGLVIYAKARDVENKMAEAFRARSIKKKYIAFVHGKPERRQGEICFPIEGKQAVTKYRVAGEKTDYSVVEVWPVTGRTNQIRIHFKRIGHPLVGEDKFAFRKDFGLRFKRLCLEASELCFRHPCTGKNLDISIGLSGDLKDFLSSHD